jgi:hypothetical protein
VFRQPASQPAGSRKLAALPSDVRKDFDRLREHQPKLLYSQKRRFDMDSTILIRVVAGVLFVIVLGILVQRRRTKV